MWKLIDGYFWPYRINEKAEVQRQLPSGRWKTVKPSLNGKVRRYDVHMKDASGVRRNVPVKRLMAQAFMPGYRPGICIGFKNGMVTDCELENLYFTTQQENGKRNGGNGRKIVEKIDRDGNVIDIYRSITDAAQKNYLSRKAVQWRCDGKLKEHDPFALTGYSFRYEKPAKY